ncbi:HEAT repeats [Candidatus Methanoperedenaceae archaeon GB50]|nr:HEAT repeats [Candidatus Methanoperedenaceae archaeon GB50]CAD7771913.1 MAG: HEAT repeats [Candidatus Methanoperedenaceae archaeon GB50]
MRGHRGWRDIESERLLRRRLCRPLDTIIKKMPDSEKQQYLNVIIPKLKDANKNVRGRAAWALEKIGDTRAVEPLMEVLKDESENVRWGAADALRKIRSKKQN